jgi:actin-related protein
MLYHVAYIMCAAVFVAKNAVLSSFAIGRQTSLVIDSGHESTVGA